MGQNNELLLPPLGGVFNVKTDTWQSDQDNEAEVGAGDLSVSSKDGTVEEGVEAGYRNLHKTQEQKAKEGDCYAGKEREGVRRLAWAASPEVAQMGVATEVSEDDGNSLGNNSDFIQKEEIDCLSTVSSGSIFEPVSVLLFQTSQRIKPSETAKQNNLQLYPLENWKGGKKDNKSLSFLSCQAKGLGISDKSDALHSAPNCSEFKKKCRETALLRLPHQTKDEAQLNFKPQWESLPSPTKMTQQYHAGHTKQADQSKLSPCLKTVAKSSLGVEHIKPTIHLCTSEDLHYAQ